MYDAFSFMTGMLSKQHPDIALSIKTRQAIRSVLNQLRDGIHELLTDGILEEAEGHKLEKVSFKCYKLRCLICVFMSFVL
jgi:sodium/hydrogen exchanger 10/11